MGMKSKFDWKEFVQKVGFHRLVIIALAGIVILVFSFPSKGNWKLTNSKKSSVNTANENEAIALQAMDQYIEKKENETEDILEKVEGIGNVRVMLTLASSEEKVTLQNDDTTKEDADEKDQQGGSRKTSQYQSKQESVLVQKEGEQNPYVVQINSPAIEGVVVVAQGAESASKQTEIIEAIQALFPIEAHKIKVMKME